MLVVLSTGGVCVISGYWLALQAGLSGLYKCEDVACPSIVALVTGPIFSAALATIALLIFVAIRVWKSSINKHGDNLP
ncbi:hypothetical protein ASF29_16005 [Rhizobium sp. Leaf262]|nr:hypothetical protein ASF29_16005 [Rhizobium sp. Leaf262]